jgi:hypothetical protein
MIFGDVEWHGIHGSNHGWTQDLEMGRLSGGSDEFGEPSGSVLHLEE